MNIGLCDDNNEAMLLLSGLIEKAAKARNQKVNIDCYYTGQSIIEKCEIYDAIFMDIEMPEINGIDVGREIKRINPSCILIMATAYDDKFKEAFKIEASRYLTKPYDSSEVSEAVDYISSRTNGSQILQVYFQRNLCTIDCADISYIRSINGDCECYVKGKFFRKDESLSEMEKELEESDFIRVHKSYLVNMRLIEDYTDGVLYIGDVKIPVAARRKKLFERRFILYDINHNV